MTWRLSSAVAGSPTPFSAVHSKIPASKRWTPGILKIGVCSSASPEGSMRLLPTCELCTSLTMLWIHFLMGYILNFQGRSGTWNGWRLLPFVAKWWWVGEILRRDKWVQCHFQSAPRNYRREVRGTHVGELEQMLIWNHCHYTMSHLKWKNFGKGAGICMARAFIKPRAPQQIGHERVFALNCDLKNELQNRDKIK